MTESYVLSPLLTELREDAIVDFCHSSVRPIPGWPCSTADGTEHQLEDDLNHAFRMAGYAQLRGIGISYHNGRVVLQGRVPTYFLKQVAQSLASSLPGVQAVDNNIEVACSR